VSRTTLPPWLVGRSATETGAAAGGLGARLLNAVLCDLAIDLDGSHVV